jgi:hypothetical protein
MSDTMTVKVTELASVIYAVAYMNLETGLVTVYRNGVVVSRVETLTSAIDTLALANAEDALGFSGWTATCDWTRPSAEWTEYRVEVLRVEHTTAAAEVPLSWTSVEA